MLPTRTHPACESVPAARHTTVRGREGTRGLIVLQGNVPHLKPPLCPPTNLDTVEARRIGMDAPVSRLEFEQDAGKEEEGEGLIENEQNEYAPSYSVQ